MPLRKKGIISIDIDENKIAAADFVGQNNRLYLYNYKIASSLKELAASPIFKGKPAVLSLPTQSLLLRSFAVSPAFFKGKDQDKEILGFLKHQNLSLKLEECFWKVFRLDSHLNLVAAKRATVEKNIAEAQEQGFTVQGVIPSFCALFSLINYNYGHKDKFALLNMRTLSTDLFFFESSRIYVYPLPVGRKHLEESGVSQNALIQELQRTCNTHYLQCSSAAQGAAAALYLGGLDFPQEFISSLKKIFLDYEVVNLEPLKRVDSAKNPSAFDLALMGQCVGSGLSFLGIPGALSLNLITGKIREEKATRRSGFFKKLLLALGVLFSIYLAFFTIKLFRDLKVHSLALSKTTYQVKNVLPQVKALKKEKDDLKAIDDFVADRLGQQKLYLKALSVIAEAKSPAIQITELEAKEAQGAVECFVRGISPNYDEVNAFLGQLKKDQSLKEVKVVASGRPQGENEEAVDFKLRFVVITQR